jgi:uncharacterized RDD family membrane protein YckC
MSSAQLDTRNHLSHEEAGPSFESAFFALHESPIPESPILVEPALKQQVAARLASHRARRQRIHISTPAPTPTPSPARVRAARIAAAVAERYAHSPSYHAVLATEADAAIRQAEAVAEAAAAAARAVTAAQLDLLEEIGGHLDPQDLAEPATDSVSLALSQSAAETPAPPVFAPTPGAIPPAPTEAVTPTSQMTVRLYEETVPVLASSLSQSVTNSPIGSTLDALDVHEALALDEEIAFRQSPTFEDAIPPTDIPANLIQFPRQLVAARRARPRLAEGPLREDTLAEEVSQLRIFEVEPDQLSSTPAAASAAPEWTSIMLGAQPVVASTLVEAVEPDSYPTLADAPLLQTAPLELRIMAAAVDSCIVLAVMLAFTAAAVLTIGTLPALQFEWPATFSAIPDFIGHLLPGVVGFTTVFVALTAIYQALFFTFSDSTPGMNYARIGLCTFSDDNPTRSQMRRRVLAFLVSACPLGLGLVWSWIDTDRLGWHDRLSRMYQRSY